MWKKPNRSKKAIVPISNPIETNVSTESKVIGTLNDPPSTRMEQSKIGRTVYIKGDIHTKENLIILGRVEGSVFVEDHAIIIGRTADLTANVYGKSVEIEGQLHGDIFALEQVIVRKNGNIEGNIAAARVTIEDGATLKGTVNMDQNYLNSHFPNKKVMTQQTLEKSKQLKVQQKITEENIK